MKILITGGPVHAKLDAVKIITNKFKGGLMAELAELLLYQECEVTYLTAKGAKLPDVVELDNGANVKKAQAEILYHDGFHDYHKQVLALAPAFDAVVLGGAVANLIPLEPLTGKFPSHNYKPGDIIPINFTIAPRVIDDVKKVAPNTHLFGFKLLSGVPHEELISAAYGVLLESKATAVFANDAKNLMVKYAVTKERGEHPMNINDMAKFIVECVGDVYYKTVLCPTHEATDSTKAIRDFNVISGMYADNYTEVPEGYMFGTIAVRNHDGSFITTGRGKHELDDKVLVYNVNHDKHVVEVHGEKKASLNAPLLDWIFKHTPNVHAIVHFHTQCPDADIKTLPYAIPGTVRDSQRTVRKSFNIEGHGCFLFLDDELNDL